MISPVRRPVEIAGERCRVRDLRPDDADELLELRIRNRDFFEPFEPALPPDHFTRRAQLDGIVHGNRAWDDDREYTFGITLPAGGLAGRIRLSVVVRGPGAPSWKRGRLAVRGRGPRDTYG